MINITQLFEVLLRTLNNLMVFFDTEYLEWNQTKTAHEIRTNQYKENKGSNQSSLRGKQRSGSKDYSLKNGTISLNQSLVDIMEKI